MDGNNGNNGLPGRRRVNDTFGNNGQRDDDLLFNQGENQNPFAGYREQNNNDVDEAEEDDGIDGLGHDDEGDGNEDDNVEGDDLDEHMEEDYEHRPELDNYDDIGIDDTR